jgi:hypothetical protein
MAAGDDAVDGGLGLVDVKAGFGGGLRFPEVHEGRIRPARLWSGEERNRLSNSSRTGKNRLFLSEIRTAGNTFADRGWLRV